MNTPAWVGPTVAIALVIIATAFVVMGGVALAIGLALRRERDHLRQAITRFAGEAREATAKIRHELEGYAQLSEEVRVKTRSAVRRLDGRLEDLDALVEVLQEEAEETALDVAAFLRTTRRAGGILGTARRALLGRRRRRG